MTRSSPPAPVRFRSRAALAARRPAMAVLHGRVDLLPRRPFGMAMQVVEQRHDLFRRRLDGQAALDAEGVGHGGCIGEQAARAASSARPGAPNPSSVATLNCARSARSPDRLSNPPLPALVRTPGTSPSAMVSAGDRRASSAASSPGSQAISSNRPVEMSAAAMPHSPAPAVATAASQLADAGASRVSSVKVPGVTSRMIARSTKALEPRALRASAGLSICSAMATRWPALISRAR